MPVSSFAPEFLELFKSAAQEEVLIKLGNKKRAVRLRFRLNMLRKDMRNEQHTLVTIANSVQFNLTDEGDLICSPADSSFLEAIKEAGVEVPLPISNPTTIPSLPKAERADAEETLRKFLKGT